MRVCVKISDNGLSEVMAKQCILIKQVYNQLYSQTLLTWLLRGERIYKSKYCQDVVELSRVDQWLSLSRHPYRSNLKINLV